MKLLRFSHRDLRRVEIKCGNFKITTNTWNEISRSGIWKEFFKMRSLSKNVEFGKSVSECSRPSSKNVLNKMLEKYSMFSHLCLSSTFFKSCCWKDFPFSSLAKKKTFSPFSSVPENGFSVILIRKQATNNILLAGVSFLFESTPNMH